MTEQVQLAIIGAGPAGLAAAATAADAGVKVLLIDEQPTAGGQIYRALGQAEEAREIILGPDYTDGRPLLGALEHPSIRHLADASVWQITPEREVFLSQHGEARCLRAGHIILATGATERPMPFPGWTLPGVMTGGAGQTLLKSAGLVPQGDIVLAGSGPLLYLLAWQYLRAGVKVNAIVETTPGSHYRKALPHLLGALRANSYLRKGLSLIRDMRRHGVPHYRRATELEATGTEQIQSLRFKAGDTPRELPCSILLLHQGVVPNVQISRSLGIAHDWDELQRCWRPRLGLWGDTEIEGISIAGDGGGIGGAKAAEHQGRLAGLHAASRLGTITFDECKRRAELERRALAYHLGIRPFLDALYAPTAEFRSPSDDTIVCRCEEVTAGAIREYVKLGCLGPNQTKAFGRPGMGPCQGRFCGLTVSEIIAAARDVPVSDVGYYRLRPPIKPVTLGELAAMHEIDEPELSQQDVV